MSTPTLPEISTPLSKDNLLAADRLMRAYGLVPGPRHNLWLPARPRMTSNDVDGTTTKAMTREQAANIGAVIVGQPDEDSAMVDVILPASQKGYALAAEAGLIVAGNSGRPPWTFEAMVALGATRMIVSCLEGALGIDMRADEHVIRERKLWMMPFSDEQREIVLAVMAKYSIGAIEYFGLDNGGRRQYVMSKDRPGDACDHKRAVTGFINDRRRPAAIPTTLIKAKTSITGNRQAGRALAVELQRAVGSMGLTVKVSEVDGRDLVIVNVIRADSGKDAGIQRALDFINSPRYWGTTPTTPVTPDNVVHIDDDSNTATDVGTLVVVQGDKAGGKIAARHAHWLAPPFEKGGHGRALMATAAIAKAVA